MVPSKDKSLAVSINAFDSAGNVIKGYQIWTKRQKKNEENNVDVYTRCEVLPGSTPTLLKCRDVDSSKPNIFSVDVKNAFDCNFDIDPLSYKDIGLIPHKNMPCVLDFLRIRYLNQQIYTYADPLLVVLNPFKNLNNTTVEIIKKYKQCENVSQLPPHVFAIARTAVENLEGYNKSQTIIVSGESGAGKTETSKQIMNYLASVKSSSAKSTIQDAVLAANPILEAFGNAKTVRNNNSSRFGRFVQLTINSIHGIQHGYIRNFLLEKSRIVEQSKDERCYHIFYHMLKGASPEQKEKYYLLPIPDYKFLNPSCYEVENMNDKAEWKVVISSLSHLLKDDAEYDFIFSILSAILLLGNIKMIGDDKAHVSEESEEIFRQVCSLLQVDERFVREALCVKISVAGHDIVHGYWDQKYAEILKESFAKALYERLFSWIVSQLNQKIAPKNDFDQFIGMLDIFGFEIFDHNSLEQLFINITNEMLQNVFIDIVFKKEKQLYKDESIPTVDLVWTSNDKVLSLLVGKQCSIMTCLEDQCFAPGGTDQKFVFSAYKNIKSETLRPGKVAPDQNFIVVHTVGPIQYESEGFLNKNKDILRYELVEVAKNSKNVYVRSLFSNITVEKGKIAKGQLNGSQFKKELDNMMKKIRSTETHFIRCVKPNDEKKALLFDASKVLPQLLALSILEALELRNLGFSYRRTFKEFIAQFKFVDLGLTKQAIEPAEAAVKILQRGKIDSKDYHVGRTMIFVKNDSIKSLIQYQRHALSMWGPLISLFEAMLLRKRTYHKIQETVPGLKRFQANIRKLIYS